MATDNPPGYASKTRRPICHRRCERRLVAKGAWGTARATAGTRRRNERACFRSMYETSPCRILNDLISRQPHLLTKYLSMSRMFAQDGMMSLTQLCNDVG